ncbi:MULTISPECIES: hypothetical protein [Mycobacteriaceae]|uniref:Uncharacterized protein n=2 Tax=Mycolicibacterium TaxID=1866885 RepID=A0ABR5FMJ0_9MYCO|nr:MULTISPECIES: hypothetical protein [Mycolicibacterium]KLI09345.1 hypothetical protein AA982_04710 [Mycolicibacterium senegalense]KLO47737.1 hypothetical protein ABW05_31730 [Mycolicibacterium senegalense]OMB90681.1 hypothetical protein A5741_11690 [Mycolicibacterium conceptionense]
MGSEQILGEVTAISATTRQEIAACRALGLGYWSQAPHPGCVWAIDDERVAHLVRVIASRNAVQAKCGRNDAPLRPRVCTHTNARITFGSALAPDPPTLFDDDTSLLSA